METLNVNVKETINNSVESNNAIMGNVDELTKVLKQEKKALNRLIKYALLILTSLRAAPDTRSMYNIPPRRNFLRV